jgi:hypothetical protein
MIRKEAEPLFWARPLSSWLAAPGDMDAAKGIRQQDCQLASLSQVPVSVDSDANGYMGP